MDEEVKEIQDSKIKGQKLNGIVLQSLCNGFLSDGFKRVEVKIIQLETEVTMILTKQSA